MSSDITSGRVKYFLEEKGWGCIVSDDVPADVFIHFSRIEGEGFRAFSEGDLVEFRYEDCEGMQDSWKFRASWAKKAVGSTQPR